MPKKSKKSARVHQTSGTYTFAVQEFRKKGNNDVVYILPEEIWSHIFSYLAANELMRTSQVSKLFKLLTENNRLWELLIEKLPEPFIWRQISEVSAKNAYQYCVYIKCRQAEYRKKYPDHIVEIPKIKPYKAGFHLFKKSNDWEKFTELAATGDQNSLEMFANEQLKKLEPYNISNKSYDRPFKITLFKEKCSFSDLTPMLIYALNNHRNSNAFRQIIDFMKKAQIPELSMSIVFKEPDNIKNCWLLSRLVENNYLSAETMIAFIFVDSFLYKHHFWVIDFLAAFDENFHKRKIKNGINVIQYGLCRCMKALTEKQRAQAAQDYYSKNYGMLPSFGEEDIYTRQEISKRESLQASVQRSSSALIQAVNIVNYLMIALNKLTRIKSLLSEYIPGLHEYVPGFDPLEAFLKLEKEGLAEFRKYIIYFDLDLYQKNYGKTGLQTAIQTKNSIAIKYFEEMRPVIAASSKEEEPIGAINAFQNN